MNQPPTLRRSGWIVVIYTSPALREKGNSTQSWWSYRTLLPTPRRLESTSTGSGNTIAAWGKYLWSTLWRLMGSPRRRGIYSGLWETWNMLGYVQGPVGDMEHACLRTGACGRHGTCLPTYRGLWETWNMLAYVQGPVGDMEHACLRTGAWNQHLEECETLLQFNNLNLRYVSLPVFSSLLSSTCQHSRHACFCQTGSKGQ